MGKCKRCGCELEYSGMGRPRKYCKDCAYVENIEYMRGYMIRRRNLGTSDFFSHAIVDNFERESREIKKEIRKHGFKRQFT